MTESHVTHGTLGPGRRVVIPSDICRQHHLAPGDPVVIESSKDGVLLRPFSSVIREVQAYFADAAPPEVILSDELLADRRAEAERESRD